MRTLPRFLRRLRLLAFALPLAALAQTEGTANWSFLTSGAISSTPSVATDGTIYVGNEGTVATQSRLYAIRADGSLRWQFAGATDWITGAPAVGSDGTVYVGSWDGKLYAINPSTGATRWVYSTSGFVASSPAIAPDGTIYVGSGDRSLHAVNPDGSVKWTYPVADWIDSSPAIAGDGTIYFGSYDNNVYALTAAGALRWQFNAGDNVTSSPAIGADGTVYVGCANGKLYALDGANGAKRWEYTTGSGIAASPIVSANGTVYVGSIDGYFYALSASTGTLVWRTNLGAEIYSTAALRADGTIIVGASVYVYGLNSDGSQRWRLATGDFVDSSPLVTSDGTIYVGSADKRLYSIRGNGTALATSAAWPTFHQSNDRLGRTAASSSGGSTNTAPTISSILSSQVATAGNTVSLSVSASGTGPLTYQWRKNGTAISGATSSTLTLPSVTTADSASYTVAVTNSVGTTVSSALVLTVNAVVIAQPVGLAVDAAGAVYVSDPSTNVVHLVSTAGVVSALAGTSGSSGSTDGTGTAARFNQPRGLALSGSSLRLADTGNSSVRSLTTAGVVTTLAGSLNGPQAVAFDSTGNIYVADTLSHTIRKITAGGTVSTLAGSNGASGSTDGTGSAARFNSPSGIAVDLTGNVFVADTTNNTIRKITSAGVVTTFAGLAGVSGTSDGTGAAALFNRPIGLAFDGSGNLYVADAGNSTLRRISSAGVVTTFAGLPGIAGLQDGNSIGAYFTQPQGLAFDAAGNLYVADTGNAALRRVSSDAVVTTISLSAASTGGGSSGGGSSGGGSTGGTTSSGGGGGGGGAPTPFAVLALLAALVARAYARR